MPDEIVPAPAATVPPAAPAAVPPVAAAPAAPPAAAPAPAAVPTAATLPIAPVAPATPAPAAAPAPAASAASTAETDPATATANRLRALEMRTVMAETGLKPSLAKYLTATDEAGMRAQADELIADLGDAAKVPAPGAPAPADGSETPAPGTAPAATPAPAPAAGTVTNPPAPKQPTIDERINQALKDGKVSLYIQLSREKAGMRA